LPSNTSILREGLRVPDIFVPRLPTAITSSCSNVVPVVIEEGVEMPDDIIYLELFHLTGVDFDERMQMLIGDLKGRDME
jgi:hypothetical protein